MSVLHVNHIKAKLADIYKAKIYSNIGQYVEDRWFPFNLTSTAKFGYSIYTLDSDPNVSINEIEQGMGVGIYPNPANNQLNILFNTDSKDWTLEVYDVTGKHLQSYNFKNLGEGEKNQVIDISGFTNGLYLCRFSSGDKIINKKFIKN